MPIILHLPPDVEQAYRAEARARGVSIDTLVSEVLIARQPHAESAGPVFAEGLGMFGSPEDAALLDEVVAEVYEERRRPAKPSHVS
jgi:hypothetical protein